MLKESYLVCHCGKKKSFKEKSEALNHADALTKLGYGVKVYLLEQSLFVETKILIYASCNQCFKDVFKQFQNKGVKSNG